MSATSGPRTLVCTHSPIAKTIATPARRLVAASSEWVSVAGSTASRLTAKSALDAAKAGSVGVCRCDGLGSRARYGSEHDQRECGVGDGVEEIERLERAEPLCECDDEAGYGRAGADTEVARDAVNREGGRSLLALDQPDGQCPVGRPCRADSGSADNRAGKGLPGTVYVGEAGVAEGARQASCDHDRF